MDTASLEAFVAVAEEGSFTAATGRLHRTQPAISKRIAQLERTLGTSLFDRIGRRTRLTESGQALLPRARAILLELDDTRRAIENLSGRIGGTLCFATSHHVGLHHLPPVLRAYAARYPDVLLEPRFLDSEAACQAVQKGDCELAVVTLPPDPAPPLRVHRIWRDPLEPVVANGDRRPAGVRRGIVREIRGLRPVLPASGTFTRAVIDEGLGEIGIHPAAVLEINHLETIRMLVAVGFGWSVLPRTMLDDTVRSIDTAPACPVRNLGVVVHENRTLGNAAGALLELLLEQRDPA